MIRPSDRRYVVEPVPSTEEALEFMRKFPDRFMMGFETGEEATKYWKLRIQALLTRSEPLYFIRDLHNKRLPIFLDVKHVAEPRAALYEALAMTLGAA
jgi:hypothetical protein